MTNEERDIREALEERRQRQLRMEIELTDEFLKRGAMQVAADNHMTLSEYVQDLMEKDVSKALGYKIVIKCEDGTNHEETDFYTLQDMQESMMAFHMLFINENPTHNGRIIAYEVWQHGKLLLSTEQLETIFTCPFGIPVELQIKYQMSKMPK